MKRNAFPARVKYSWTTRTFSFALSLTPVRNAGKSRGCGGPGRLAPAITLEGQGLCRPLGSALTVLIYGHSLPPRMENFISRDRLATLLGAAPAHRIAIVGDAMLDVYLRGDVDRISPEAPVPVVRVRQRELALGGAANVANNVIALGARCELVCTIGADPAGVSVREMLAARGAETRSLVVTPRPTTTKTRVLARSQQVVRFDEEEDADITAGDLSGLLAAVDRVIEDASALVL